MMVPAGINTVKKNKLKKDIAAQSSFVKKHLPLFRRFSIPHLLIIILGFIVYSNTFHVPFLFDDESSIYGNIIIRDSAYFTNTSLSDIFLASRIIGQLTFAMNYAVHGLNVVGYHVVNLLIHVGCALLLYWFCILTFKTPYVSDHFLELGDSLNTPKMFALFAALFFVSHPIQTQAVTYIVQRYASLATFFYLFSVIMYIKFRLSESSMVRYALYAVSFVSAILAMKTKEIAFTLPLMIILYEFMFFRGEIRKRIIYLIPLTLTMIIIPLSLIGVHGSSPDSAVRIDELTKGASLNIISAGDYLTTQFRVIVTYIRLLFLPINQNLDYDYPVYKTFFTLPVFFSFLFLLMIFGWGVYLLYRSSQRLDSRLRGNDTKGKIKTFAENSGNKNEEKCWYRLIAFGIFWFFVTISVESSIIPIADVIFEHRLYLPSVGFFISVMAGVMWFTGRWVNKPLIKRAVLTAMILVIVVLSATAYARNNVWHDELTLWKDVVKKSPQVYRANFNLGLFHAKVGRFDDAIREFQAAIVINPNYPEVYNNLGLAYLHKGNTDAALINLQTAIKLEPRAGYIYESLGQVYTAQGRNEEGIRSFQKALELDPNDTEARKNLDNLQKLIKNKTKE